MGAYLPDWDVRNDDYPHTTLDLSHTAVSRSDAVEMALDLGDRLAHVHLADGTDSARDEHLIPGRGDQPVAQVLTMLAGRGFDRDGDRRGQHASGARPRRAGGRPRRGPGLRPAAPRAGRGAPHVGAATTHPDA